MAALSKQRFKILEHNPCSTLHPTTTCSGNAARVLVMSIWGSTKYFLVIYLVQFLLKQRKLSRQVLLDQAICLMRSTLFGSSCSVIAVSSICVFRQILGKFSTYTLGILTGIVGGTGIFFEVPSRRGTDVTLFIALVTDLYLKVIHDLYLNKAISLNQELLIFSVCSSMLLYCLRVIPGSYTTLWPVTPHRLPQDKEKRKNCAHKGGCWDQIRKTGATYFGYGLAVQVIKIATMHFKKIFHSPKSFLGEFLKMNNLRLPLFAGLYIVLFKGINCFLRKLRGQDEAWHTLPAGAVASLCYLIQPNQSLAMMAFSNLSQVLCRKWRKDIGLPDGPWEQLVFMIGMGLLFHARSSYPQAFPPYMFKIMDGVTDGRAQVVYSLVEKDMLLRF